MPWKSNPTGGIIKGKVSSTTSSPYPYFNGNAVYKALVTYSGPYGFGTTVTDGNGYFVLMDVPYGTYTVSAYTPPSNSGPAAATVTNINVTRGVVTNVDLTFGITSISDWSDYQNNRKPSPPTNLKILSP